MPCDPITGIVLPTVVGVAAPVAADALKETAKELKEDYEAGNLEELRGFFLEDLGRGSVGEKIAKGAMAVPLVVIVPPVTLVVCAAKGAYKAVRKFFK